MSDNPKFPIVQNDLLVDQRLAYLYGQIKKLKKTPVVTASSAATTITNNTLLKRETVNLATGVLAAGSQELGSVSLGKTFALMSITASQPCRVRLYSSADLRAVDIALARGAAMPPAAFSEHGTIFDWNTQDAPTVSVSTWDGGITTFKFDNVLTATQLLSDEHPIAGHPIGWTPGPGDVIELFTTCPSPYTISAVFSDGINDLGDAGTTGSGVGITGPARIIPAGTTQINYTLHNSGFHGSQWAVQVNIARDAVFTYPNYPVSFVCSPEAPGSDKSSFPSGDIAYAVDNLGISSAAIAVAFEILREEK